MKKEEIETTIQKKLINNISNIIDSLITILFADKAEVIKLIKDFAKTPCIMKEVFYWNKFYMFLSGIKQIEENIDESRKLKEVICDDTSKKSQNAVRLLEYIDKADSEKKIDDYIQITKNLLCGYINQVEYFRIMKAVLETLDEDLQYLTEISKDEASYKGSIQMLALERSGLVIRLGIDGNENIEEQDYVISSLGKMVSKYIRRPHCSQKDHIVPRDLKKSELGD